MKTKLTVCVIVLYVAAVAIWENVKSPVTGAASAAQLDDTLKSYMAAKALSDSTPEQVGTLLCAAIIAAIWLIPSRKKTTQQ